jgi:DNA topoisomerase-1
MSDMPRFLRYSSQDEPGFGRRRRGKGFQYLDVSGKTLEDEKALERIHALGLPPAYEDVWICRDAHGHLQAAGTDARGRRQYRYHPDWRAYRDRAKFDRLEAFGRALPRLRDRVARDLRRNRPDRDHVTAALVRLIDDAALRVGSDRYARDNKTYGASTLLSRHLKLDGATLKLSYTAKGGRRVRKQVKDRTLARVLETICDLPGRALFTCEDEDGEVRAVHSDDVNRYISAATEEDGMTAKTFRTWHGTLVALDAAAEAGSSELTIKAMSQAAAERLHNTPSIARNSYIHPDVIALAEMDPDARADQLDAVDLRRAPNGLEANEKRLVAFLAP